jgi:hypothetical protein
MDIRSASDESHPHPSPLLRHVPQHLVQPPRYRINKTRTQLQSSNSARRFQQTALSNPRSRFSHILLCIKRETSASVLGWNLGTRECGLCPYIMPTIFLIMHNCPTNVITTALPIGSPCPSLEIPVNILGGAICHDSALCPALAPSHRRHRNQSSSTHHFLGV